MPNTATARPAVSSLVLVVVDAVLLGLIIGMFAANVWPILLNLNAPVASVLEIVFLSAYIFWVSGGGPRINGARFGPSAACVSAGLPLASHALRWRR